MEYVKQFSDLKAITETYSIPKDRHFQNFQNSFDYDSSKQAFQLQTTASSNKVLDQSVSTRRCWSSTFSEFSRYTHTMGHFDVSRMVFFATDYGAETSREEIFLTIVKVKHVPGVGSS